MIEKAVDIAHKIKVLPSIKLVLGTLNTKSEVISANDIYMINHICPDVLKIRTDNSDDISNQIVELSTLRSKNKIVDRKEVLKNKLSEYFFSKYSEYMKTADLPMYYSIFFYCFYLLI